MIREVSFQRLWLFGSCFQHPKALRRRAKWKTHSDQGKQSGLLPVQEPPEILGDNWHRRQDLAQIFNSYTQNTSRFGEKQDTKGSCQPHSTAEECRKGWRCSGLLSTFRQSSHHLLQPLCHSQAPEEMLSPISASLVLLSQAKFCPGKVPQSGCLRKGCEVVAEGVTATSSRGFCGVSIEVITKVMEINLCFVRVSIPSHIPFAWLYFKERDYCSFIPGWAESSLVYLIKERISALCSKHQNTDTNPLARTAQLGHPRTASSSPNTAQLSSWAPGILRQELLSSTPAQ